MINETEWVVCNTGVNETDRLFAIMEGNVPHSYLKKIPNLSWLAGDMLQLFVSMMLSSRKLGDIMKGAHIQKYKNSGTES